MEARHEQWCGGIGNVSRAIRCHLFLVCVVRPAFAPIDQKYAGKEPTPAKSKPKLLASTPALFRPASPTTPASRRSRNHMICAPLPGEPTDPTGGPKRHRDRPVSARQTDPRLTFSFTQCFLFVMMSAVAIANFPNRTPNSLDAKPKQNEFPAHVCRTTET